ncbi:MAG TPA: hypothetical protein VF931_03510, partial [Steroidobacteraceae bacterium]
AQNETPASTLLTINFSGAGAAVGTLPGQTKPDWVTVSGLTLATTKQATVTISVAPGGIAPGNYLTTLRFATADADLTHQAYVDLTVSMAVREGLGIASSPAPSFTLVQGSSVSAPNLLTLAITGSGTQWPITQKPAWIDLTAMSGAGPATITATLNAAAQLLSAYSIAYVDYIRVFDSVSRVETDLAVTLQINRVIPTLNPTALTFSVDSTTTDAQLSQTVQVSDTALGQNSSLALTWTADGDLYPDQSTRLPEPPFIASVFAGDTAGSPTNVVISLRRQVLSGLMPGTHQLSAVFHFISPDKTLLSADISLPLTITVRLPRGSTAAPAVIAAGAPGTVQLIGEDFQATDLAQLRINGGGLPAGSSVALVDSQTLNLTLPALSAGRYAIDFANALGLRRSYAEVQSVPVVSAPGAGLVASVSAPHYRLYYDDMRRRLYSVALDLQHLARYQWNGSAWQTLTPISLVAQGTLVLGRNGRELYVSTSDGIWAQDVDTGATTTQVAAPAVSTCAGSGAGWLAATEYGSLLATHPGCTTVAGDLAEFDLIGGGAGPPVQAGFSYRSYPLSSNLDADLGTSPDGRFVLSETLGGFALLDTRFHQFVAPQGVLSQAGHWNSGSMNFLAADATGQQLLLRNGAVADRSGNVLGVLPKHSSAVLRNDGQTAVILVYDGQGASHLAIVNIGSAVGPFNVFPQIGADIPVSPSLGRLEATGYADSILQLVLSADEHVAFVSGPDNIAAVALP